MEKYLSEVNQFDERIGSWLRFNGKTQNPIIENTF